MSKGIETYWTPDHAGVAVLGEKKIDTISEAFTNAEQRSKQITELAHRKVFERWLSDGLTFDRHEVPIVISALGLLAAETGRHRVLKNRRIKNLIADLAISQYDGRGKEDTMRGGATFVLHVSEDFDAEYSPEELGFRSREELERSLPAPSVPSGTEDTQDTETNSV